MFVFPKRESWSHKGQAGKLLIIGGSMRYSGSPALAALAAIRTGTDLTLVAAPRRAADIIASLKPDLITESTCQNYVCPKDVDHLAELANWSDAVIIGGGLDRKKSTYSAIRSLLVKLNKIKKPCIIDAEAIRAVASHPELIGENCVITPHEEEFHVLGGDVPSKNIKKRKNQVKTISTKLGATVFLKGMVDVISDGKRTCISKTGNPYMAKGGTGDVLAGICGSIMARGISPFDAACASAWINGAAGDMALKKIGPGFFVSEMLDFIPKVIWG